MLSSSKLSTISETLALLSTASATLLNSQQDPIPASAGTDLFQRYIVASFQQIPATPKSGADFTVLKNQLIGNSKLFVSRAKTARQKIAIHAFPFIREDCTVIIYGYSRSVAEVLSHAAEEGTYFQVISITASEGQDSRLGKFLDRLKSFSIPVASIPLSALSYTLCSLPRSTIATLALLGAEAVLENGSTVSGMGTHVVAQITNAYEIPSYFAAESYKFVRSFPLTYGSEDLERMGAKQNVLKFTTGSIGQQQGSQSMQPSQMMDITRPELITALITETGVMTPNAVAEELIKLWF